MKTVIILILFCGFIFSQSTFKERLDHLSSKDNFKSQKERLEAFFDFYADYLKENSPAWATSMGFKGYQAKWAPASLTAIKNSHLENQSIQKALKGFDKGEMDTRTKVYFNLMQQNVDISIGLVDMEMFYFPVVQQGYSPLGGNSHLSLISSITNLPTSTKKDLENILILLDNVDIRINEIIEILDEGIKKGYTTPKVTVLDVVNQISSITESDIESNPFYSSFKSLNNFSEQEIAAFQNKAKSIIEKKIVPAYKKLKTFMQEDYIPACRNKVGISSLKDGDKKYNFLISYYTTTSLTAKEIHELGLSEVARILKEMEKVKTQTGFKGDLSAFNNFLRTDPQFFFTKKEDLLKEYRDICKRVDPGLIKLFGKLPRLPYGVIPIPEYSEKSSTTAYYDYGSLAQGIPGYFYANTYKLETRPKWEMEALSLHESVPGHHLQLALAQEITGQPDFMKFLQYTAFVEGWGLYSESLGSDLGMYKDPYSKYGQLTYEMWRAIRLVVDTGIHAFGWSREKAITYFMANSAKTENDITVEIDRYIAWPGQALAYKIGELKLKELRARAQKELGENFNIRDFHDLVLSEGSLPLSILETMVNDWIAEQKVNK